MIASAARLRYWVREEITEVRGRTLLPGVFRNTRSCALSRLGNGVGSISRFGASHGFLGTEPWLAPKRLILEFGAGKAETKQGGGEEQARCFDKDGLNRVFAAADLRRSKTGSLLQSHTVEVVGVRKSGPPGRA